MGDIIVYLYADRSAPIVRERIEITNHSLQEQNADIEERRWDQVHKICP